MRMPAPARAPITIPAIAPPDRPPEPPEGGDANCDSWPAAETGASAKGSKGASSVGEGLGKASLRTAYDHIRVRTRRGPGRGVGPVQLLDLAISKRRRPDHEVCQLPVIVPGKGGEGVWVCFRDARHVAWYLVPL